MDIGGRLNQANGRLKASKVGVAILQRGNRLYLRATLPPKPDSPKTIHHQQEISLGCHANPSGLQLAEKEARKVGALLDCKEFSWLSYLSNSDRSTPIVVRDWIEKFEADYFNRHQRNSKTETTWEGDYQKIFKKLPETQLLTSELLLKGIESTPPDTRTRRRACTVLGSLAKFAGIDVDVKPFRGKYNPSRATPRDLPSDSLIAEWFDRIPNPEWRWAFGMMATYGLRNHELFYLDFSKMPILLIVDGAKTGGRRIYPLYPEWVEQWKLPSMKIPACNGRNNSELGNRVTHAFSRYNVPFAPYNLRHRWAVRSIEFGLPVELAAQQMGHSVQVHCNIYHHWITEDVHQRAFDLLLLRSDRPLPPSVVKEK